MQNIETLVFDYGGVIVNIDDNKVAKAMTDLAQLLRFSPVLLANQQFAFLICFTVFYKF